MQNFLTAVYTKISLPQSFLPDMEVLRKIFLTILDMKNAYRAQHNFFQNCAKDRMTDFNISVTAKYRRDKYYVF